MPSFQQVAFFLVSQFIVLYLVGARWSFLWTSAVLLLFQVPLRYSTSPRRQRAKLVPKMLSIVVPCYNEEKRLPVMLRDTFAFMQKYLQSPRALITSYEVIVVNDGSKDETEAVAQRFFREFHVEGLHCQIVKVTPNRGKGYAVRTGFLEASGEFVLMVDGDNATKISDCEKLLAEMVRSQADIAVGSRAHLEKESIAKRTLGRTILMWAFHFVVYITYFFGKISLQQPPKDTQCGFKLFRQSSCESIFLKSRLERWAFDVELLIYAKRLNLKVVEVAVEWNEIEGSKLRLWGMMQMGLECLLMCVAFPLAIWS